MMSRRVLWAYCLSVFAASWLLQGMAIVRVGDLEKPAAGPWLIGAMFVPAIVTLGFMLLYPQARIAVAWKPTWRMLPLSILAFTVPTLIAFAVLATIEIGRYGHAGWFAFSTPGVAVSGGPWLLGRGAQNWPYFIANAAVTGAAYSLLNALAAMGEELGWRGFLQGQLIARLGTIRGIVLLGLIWAFWHLPALLAGYNYPQHPILGAFVLFPVELVAISFFLGWLTLRAGTFWPAAIAHGAANSIEAGVIGNLHLVVPQLAEDMLRMSFTVLVGAIFLWVLNTAKFKRAQ